MPERKVLVLEKGSEMRRASRNPTLPEEESPPLLCEQQTGGNWWLPKSPQQKVSGTLHFVPFEGITLDLTGSMPRPAGSTDMLQSPIILGQAHNGTPVTLLSAFENHWQPGTSGGRSSWLANRALVGKHYEERADLTFDKISVRSTGLEHWLGHKTIRLDAKQRDRRTLTYSLPEEPEISIPALSATLAIRSFGKVRQDRCSAALAHANYLEVTPDEPCGFRAASSVVFCLQNLLMLLQGGVVQMAECRMDDADLLFVQQGGGPVEERSAHEMLFPYELIREQFPQLVATWFETRDLFQPVRTLFFSQYYNPRMYPEVHFLNLMQALESYHRRRYGGTYVCAAEYERWREAMANSIPNEVPGPLRRSLLSKLQYGNEFSLRKRLKTLLASLEEEARGLIAEGYEDLVHYIVTLRNYHTHYTRELEQELRELRDGDMPSGEDYSTCLASPSQAGVCGFREGVLILPSALGYALGAWETH